MKSIKYSKLSNYKIKKIIECFSLDLTADKSSKLLKLNRKTINKYYMHFRVLIYQYQTQRMKQICGEVELDEAYFGSKRLRGVVMAQKRGRGTWKQPVFGIFERSGRVLTEIIPDAKRETLRGVIRGKIALNSVVYTDGWRGYDGLVDIGYGKHLRINKKREGFVNDKGVHINGIESFWSYVKRRLAKFNGVKSYFEYHLKECEWRWKKTDSEIASELWRMTKIKSK